MRLVNYLRFFIFVLVFLIALCEIEFPLLSVFFMFVKFKIIRIRVSDNLLLINFLLDFICLR